MILNLFLADLLSYFTEKGRRQEAEGIVTLFIFLLILLPASFNSDRLPIPINQTPTANSSPTASCSQPAFVVILYLFEKTDT